MEAFLSHLPPSGSRDYTLCLSDHRGRVFTKLFYVDRGVGNCWGWFVWGVSASGASQIVAGPRKGRRNGRKLGWGEKKAEAMAALLNGVVEQRAAPSV
jgi:hypothetical protein